MKQLILFLCCTCFFYVSASDLRGDTISIKTVQLNIDVTDFSNKKLKGEAVLGVKALQNNVSNIRLDLLKLTVDSVLVNQQNVSFGYNDTLLQFQFPAPLNQNDTASLRIFYHGTPVQEAGDFGGFYWTTSQAFNIGVSFLANPHNYGRVWFPCFDNFTERSLYEFVVTTKDIHKAFCNGMLINSSINGNTKTWHWKLGQEIPSYLASMAVTTYQTLLDTVHSIGGIRQIQIAARASDTTAVKNKFINLRSAFHIYEELWGEYQWDRVGYCMIPFNAGAMEHATNTGFMQALLYAGFEDCEDVIVHELSHNWFGNLVTCATASDMWLNEGWAVYNEHLFYEKFYGLSDYKRKVRTNHEKVLHKTHVDDNGYFAVSGVPSLLTYGSTVYDKGGDFIHTLRTYMGDSLFFSCVKNYLSDNAFQNTTTTQLLNYLNACSGLNLNDYFNDWILAAGFPHFSFTTQEVETAPFEPHSFVVNIHQRLSHAPHYYNNVPVTISYFDSLWNRTDVKTTVSGECTSVNLYQLNTPAPSYVALDFDEKLQDAITDEWKVISNTGSFDFGTAKMIVDVTQNIDSSLLRIEHNWISPEPMQNKIAGLHLHDKRFWNVDGLINVGFKANATISYNGNDISLDNPFVSNSEDSIVILYRSNDNTDWAIADSFVVNNGGNATNKLGTVTVYGLQKGQYCLGIYNSAIPDTSAPTVDCLYNSFGNNILESNFVVSPNPATNRVEVMFEKNALLSISLADLTGKELIHTAIDTHQSLLQWDIHKLPAGIYFVSATDLQGHVTTKKIIVE